MPGRSGGGAAEERAGAGGEQRAAPAGEERAAGGPGGGQEPDVRFTFANERTFLAWHRTALALVVAGLAIIQLLPPFPGVPWGRHLLAVPLIALGAVLSVASYREWARDQRALRRDEPLPPSRLPLILAGVITVLAVVAAGLAVFAAGPGG